MSKQIQEHLAIIASQIGADNGLNNIEAGIGSKIAKGLRKAANKVDDSKTAKARKYVASKVSNAKDSVARVKDYTTQSMSKAKAHIGKNKGKYATGAAVAGVGAGAYGYNKVKSNEVSASLAAGLKNVKTAFQGGYTKNAAGKFQKHADEGKVLKAARVLGENKGKAALAAGTAGIGTIGYNKMKASEEPVKSAMDIFQSITAAEYLESKLDGQLGHNVTAADYSKYMGITAMDYIIMANEESAELANASEEVLQELADAETPEQVEAILEDNANVGAAHAEKAAELADYAETEEEDADEAAALAEFHAGKAQEHQEVENDVISSLYYE